MFDKLHKLKKLSINFQGQYMNRLLVHIFRRPLLLQVEEQDCSGKYHNFRQRFYKL